MTDLALLSAAELAAGYKARRFSPVEATDAVLARIEALDGGLGAYRLVDAASARAAAKSATERWTRGAPLGPIDGVPTSVKDIILTRGWSTLRGSRTVDPDQAWDEDGPSVVRLRAAGAVLLGKTTVPELGWKALGDSPLTGIGRNPFDRSRTPGGSSGGAAIAAAAGMGALHIGTDGGGSIRIPSSFCGIAGLKPTLGRVAAYPPSPFAAVAHIGPMARTVEDLGLMLQAMAGPDPRDWTALPEDARDPNRDLDSGLAGLRLAWSPDLGFARVHADVADATARAIAQSGLAFADADIAIPAARDAFLTLWSSGAAKALSALSPEKRRLVDPGLARLADTGNRFSGPDYMDAMAVRQQLMRSFGALFERIDILVTPAVAVPPPPLGQDLSDPAAETWWIDWASFSFPFNMTGQPAAVVPCGLDRSGLPVGLQVIGRPFEEHVVLRAARALEAMFPRPVPPLAA